MTAHDDNPYQAPSTQVFTDSEDNSEDESPYCEAKLEQLNGRIGRLRFFIYTFYVFFLLLFILTIIHGVLPFKVGYTIIFLSSIVPILVFLVRRLHDLNRSGYYCLLIFVPIANVFLFFNLLLLKGRDKPNKYGKPPPPNMAQHYIGLLIAVVVTFWLVNVNLVGFRM